MSFTAQEYYAVFSMLCIGTCYFIGVARAARVDDVPTYKSETGLHHGPNTQTRWLFTRIAGGYILTMFLFLASKQLLWQIPPWAIDATRRQALEQFKYGFWPLNIATSPLINWVLVKKFGQSWLPLTETPLGSSSGILVIAALVISLITWIKPKGNGHQRQIKDNTLTLAFGGVLLTTIAIACLVATSGGLGTLFAVFVSPQLRALNRFTPYFYCASLAVCAIKLDQTLALAINIKRKQRQA